MGEVTLSGTHAINIAHAVNTIGTHCGYLGSKGIYGDRVMRRPMSRDFQ